VPNRVCMIGISCVQKLLDVISGQPCLVLDLTLGGSNNILVIFTLIVASGDCNLLGSPLWPPLVTPSAPFCVLVGTLGGAPRPLLGDAFLLLWMKMASTTSLPEACLVAILRGSFMVFGWSRTRSCTRAWQFVPDHNAKMTLVSQILGSL
jgi:hypothetical protein